MDGVHGPRSAAMMRAALAGRTHPVPPVPRPPTGTVPVDGQFGPLTCAAMQRALDRHGAGLVVDGAFGGLARRALQRYLRATADGVVGTATVRALQKHVGATRDGARGPDTTRHLQTALNDGTF